MSVDSLNELTGVRQHVLLPLQSHPRPQRRKFLERCDGLREQQTEKEPSRHFLAVEPIDIKDSVSKFSPPPLFGE